MEQTFDSIENAWKSIFEQYGKDNELGVESVDKAKKKVVDYITQHSLIKNPESALSRAILSIHSKETFLNQALTKSTRDPYSDK